MAKVLYVTPYLSPDDIRNISLLCLKHVSNFILTITRFIHFSHINNLVFRKSNVATHVMSSGPNRIQYVLFLCSKIEMVWIYAGWVIAFVKNKHSFWNTSFIDRVRKSVRFNGFSINLKNSIFFIFPSIPIPASVRFIKIIIESINNRIKIHRCIFFHGGIISYV